MGFFKDMMRSLSASSEDKIKMSQESTKAFEDEKRISIKEKEGLDYIKAIYSNQIVGIEEEYGEAISAWLFKDRLRFKTSDQNVSRDILFSNIESIELLTDTQIHEKSKVGQMLIIGLFALATKKKTEEVTTRKLVINAIEDGIKFSVVIDTLYDSLSEAKELNKSINEFKGVGV